MGVNSVREQYISARSKQLARTQLRVDGRAESPDAIERIAPRFMAQAAKEFDNRNKVNRYAYGVPRTSGNMGVISAQRKSANRPASLARMMPDLDEEA